MCPLKQTSNQTRKQTNDTFFKGLINWSSFDVDNGKCAMFHDHIYLTSFLNRNMPRLQTLQKTLYLLIRNVGLYVLYLLLLVVFQDIECTDQKTAALHNDIQQLSINLPEFTQFVQLVN